MKNSFLRPYLHWTKPTLFGSITEKFWGASKKQDTPVLCKEGFFLVLDMNLRLSWNWFFMVAGYQWRTMLEAVLAQARCVAWMQRYELVIGKFYRELAMLTGCWGCNLVTPTRQSGCFLNIFSTTVDYPAAFIVCLSTALAATNIYLHAAKNEQSIIFVHHYSYTLHIELNMQSFSFEKSHTYREEHSSKLFISQYMNNLENIC